MVAPRCPCSGWSASPAPPPAFAARVHPSRQCTACLQLGTAICPPQASRSLLRFWTSPHDVRGGADGPCCEKPPGLVTAGVAWAPALADVLLTPWGGGHRRRLLSRGLLSLYQQAIPSSPPCSVSSSVSRNVACSVSNTEFRWSGSAGGAPCPSLALFRVFASGESRER